MGRILQWACCICLLIAGQSVAGTQIIAASLPPESNAPRESVEAGRTTDPGTLYRFASQTLHLKLALSAGERFEAFKWSIADSSASPNIRSELKWSDVRSHQVRFGGRMQLSHFLYGRAYVDYAWIRSGRMRDSDYDGDNRTLEYSRSLSETNADHLWDIAAGVGYPLAFRNERIFAAPMVGFSFHRQSFRITNGRQLISEDASETPPVGPLDSRLNSLYTAEWQALWLGCDLRYAMAPMPGTTSAMAFELSLKYFFLADYSAEADWNLRGDLRHPVSFEQDADGSGLSIQIKWLLPIVRHLDMSFAFDYSRWATDSGTDTFYPADPANPAQTTPLNEVVWESRSIMIGLLYRFF